MLNHLNALGSLVRDGAVTPNKLYDLIGFYAIWAWRKWEPLARVHRVRYNVPQALADLEYLNGEIVRIGAQRGHWVEPPEKFAVYFARAATNKHI